MGEINPTIFTNDAQHERQKQFCMEVLRLNHAGVLETFDRVFDEYVDRWTTIGKFVWSEEVQAFWSDLLFEWIFGFRPKRGLVGQWVLNIFDFRNIFPWSGYAHARDAFEELLAEVKSSPRLKEYAVSAESLAGFDEDETARQLLFYVGFNAWGGLQGLATSAVAELSIHPATRSKIADALRGLPREKVAESPFVENLVYEVLRLHPPVYFVDGVLKQDDVITANTGTYRVHKGDRLVGNLYFAQRDASVFDEPEKFRPERFENSGQLKYLTWANAYGTEEVKTDTKICAGRDVVYTLTRLFVAALSVESEWELNEAPKWGKHVFPAAGAPSNKLKVRRFSPRNSAL